MQPPCPPWEEPLWSNFPKPLLCTCPEGFRQSPSLEGTKQDTSGRENPQTPISKIPHQIRIGQLPHWTLYVLHRPLLYTTVSWIVFSSLISMHLMRWPWHSYSPWHHCEPPKCSPNSYRHGCFLDGLLSIQILEEREKRTPVTGP